MMSNLLRYLLPAGLCFCIAGCGWISSLWNADEDRVPVTEPSDQGQTLTFQAPPDRDEPRPGPTEGEQSPQDDQPEQQADAGENEPDDQATDQAGGAEPVALEQAGAEPKIIQEETVVAASVLSVGTTFITAEDILNGAARRLSNLPSGLSRRAFASRARQVIEEELRLQISLQLVLPEAEEALVEQQIQMLDKQMESIEREWIARAGGSRQMLETRLKKQGTSLDYQLRRRRNQILVQSYVSEKFNSAVVITRRDLWDYYQDNHDEFATPKKVRMQLIAAPFKAFGAGPNASEAHKREAAARARKVIEQAEAALKKGMSFDKAVAEFSRGPLKADGGIWPVMKRGTLRQEKLEQVAFSLREGQVSRIVEAEDGFYIVKAHEVTEGKTVSFLDAQKEIERKLRDREVDELSQEYYARLFASTDRSQQPRFLDQIVERAVERYYKP
jgi:parvulin-like peptidyl-prolyl isomerase